jgi:hypothetical protein
MAEMIDWVNKYRDHLLGLYGLLNKYEEEQCVLSKKCDALKDLIRQIELTQSNTLDFLSNIDIDYYQKLAEQE